MLVQFQFSLNSEYGDYPNYYYLAFRVIFDIILSMIKHAASCNNFYNQRKLAVSSLKIAVNETPLDLIQV